MTTTITQQAPASPKKGFLQGWKNFFRELKEEINRPLTEEELKIRNEVWTNNLYSGPFGPYGGL